MDLFEVNLRLFLEDFTSGDMEEVSEISWTPELMALEFESPQSSSPQSPAALLAPVCKSGSPLPLLSEEDPILSGPREPKLDILECAGNLSVSGMSDQSTLTGGGGGGDRFL